MIDNLETVKLAQAGDIDAKGLLIKENSGLIWSIVRKFTGRGVESDDLFQIGAMGLIKCINKFDMSYEVKFSIYAVPMIMGEIKRYLRDDGMIKVSRPLKELAIRANYMKESLYIKNGEYPTIMELAEALNTDIDQLLPAIESAKDIESIYSTVKQQDGNETYLLDRLPQKKENDYSKEDIMFLKDIIKNLSHRDRQIITLRYFGDKTQSQIADILGISQVQVSRLEKKILDQMKRQLE